MFERSAHNLHCLRAFSDDRWRPESEVSEPHKTQTLLRDGDTSSVADKLVREYAGDVREDKIDRRMLHDGAVSDFYDVVNVLAVALTHLPNVRVETDCEALVAEFTVELGELFGIRLRIRVPVRSADVLQVTLHALGNDSRFSHEKHSGLYFSHNVPPRVNVLDFPHPSFSLLYLQGAYGEGEKIAQALIQPVARVLDI